MAKVNVRELTPTSQLLVKKLQENMLPGGEFLPIEVQELLDECYAEGYGKGQDDCDCEGSYEDGYARGFDDGEESGYEAGKNER